MNRLLEIGKRSLNAYQQALNITSHNIANAQNEDYSRQVVRLTAEQSENYSKEFWAAGVKVEDVDRVKSQIIEKNIRLYNSEHAYAEQRFDSLRSIESILEEPTELGLSNAMNEFFNAWEELAVNPTSMPLRTQVIQNAERLSSKMDSVAESLDVAKQDTKTEAESVVADINNMLSQIHTLNKQVQVHAASQHEVNDLLDKRDAAINELSELVNINVSTDKNDMVNISIGGVFAVDNVYQNEFEVSEVNGKLVISSTDEESQKLAVTSGTLGALVDVYEEEIPAYKEKLLEIGQTIYDQVNSLHSSGYTNHEPPQTGINFFDDYKNGELVINDLILQDSNFIAASADGNAGDNQIAVQIADLKDAKLIEGYTFAQRYGNLVTQVGADVDEAETNQESFQLTLNQLNQSKASVSGVSMDEEMVNLIQFQRAYDASAKLISVADEMLLTILQMV